MSIHQITERRKKSLQMNFDKPGIITSNIDAVAGTHNAQQKRYELCLDGKRLTVGFGSKLGDVDLSIIAQIAPLSFQGSHRTHTQTSEVRWLHASVVTEWSPACLHKQLPGDLHRGN